MENLDGRHGELERGWSIRRLRPVNKPAIAVSNPELPG